MSSIDDWIRRIIVSVFVKIGKNYDDNRIDSLQQFIKFCMVGVTNTAISYGINAAILLFLNRYHVSWDFIAGNVIAFIISVLWSFYWNNKYVFIKKEGQKRSLWKSLLKTYLSYGFTGIILTNVMSYIWIEIMGISKFLAPLINLVISIPINFFINKFWAFKTE